MARQSPTTQKGQLVSWKVPGHGIDPDRKSVWVQVGKTTVRIGNAQIRMACGWEDWSPSEEDVKLLKDAEANLSRGLWDDSRGDPPDDEDNQLVDEEIFNFRPIQEPRQHEPLPERAQSTQQPQPHTAADLQAEPGTIMTLPAPTIQQAQQQEPAQSHDAPQPQSQHPFQQELQLAMLQSKRQQLQQIAQQSTQQNIAINIDSPTYQQYQHYQPTFGPVTPTPRGRARSRTPTNRGRPTTPQPEQKQRPAVENTHSAQAANLHPPQPQQPSTSIQQATTETPTQASTSPQLQLQPPLQPANLESTTEAMETSVLPQKRPADVLFSYYANHNGQLQPISHWDGSEDHPLPFAPSRRCYEAYLNSKQRAVEMNGISDPTRPDHDSSDEDLSLSNERGLTRQEIKQLDREVPWREIMKLDADSIQKYVDSAKNEYDGSMKWGGVRLLSKQEAAQVRSSARLKRRVMKSRAAYRDKARGCGPLKAKTRVVVIGCGDRDLRQLSRDSPTPSRLSEMVIMMIAASGANGDFNQDNLRWTLWVSDAERLSQNPSPSRSWKNCSHGVQQQGSLRTNQVCTAGRKFQ